MSCIDESTKAKQESTSSEKVGKSLFEENESSSTEEEENGSQVLACVWSPSISESPLQQTSMESTKHTPEKGKQQLQREKSSSVDTFVSPILTKRNRLSLPSDKISIQKKVHY